MSQVLQTISQQASETSEQTQKIRRISNYTRSRCLTPGCKGFATNPKDSKYKPDEHCKKCLSENKDRIRITDCSICGGSYCVSTLYTPNNRAIGSVCLSCSFKVDEREVFKFIKKQAIKAKDITIDHVIKFFPEFQDEEETEEEETEEKEIEEENGDDDNSDNEDVEPDINYEEKRQLHLSKVMKKELPFPVIYKSGCISIPPEAKRFCNLLIPGRVISGGRQLCHQRIIDKENIALFTLWCHDNKRSDLFTDKLHNLNLNEVYTYLYGC